MTTTDYLALLTTEHADKTTFVATVAASIDPLTKLQAVLHGWVSDFDLETAIGVQLDVIGQWVGRSRHIRAPLVGVYFTWDDAASDGWDFGAWQGPYDPSSGLVDLPDDAYRLLLKVKVLANRWDGSIPGAYAILSAAFGPTTTIVIQDNQDMTMVIGVSGARLSTINQAILTQSYLPLKPEGVLIARYAVVPSAGKLFAWDIAPNATFDGWDTGLWPLELIPA